MPETKAGPAEGVMCAHDAPMQRGHRALVAVMKR